MDEEHKLLPLKSIAEITSGKRPPEISKTPSDRFQFPVIGGGGPSGFTISPLVEEKILITGRVGTLGKLFINDGPCWPSDNALVIRPLSEVTDQQFLRYALQMVIGQAAGMNRGAANPLITQGDLGRLQVSHPPLSKQRAIASVLGALDDKIEHNRRTARALGRLARATFRAWFVNFEPVKAKAAGATAFPSMPQPIFDALPTTFTDSGIGHVPDRWEVKSIEKLAELRGGKQLEKQHISERGPVPVFGGAGVMGYTTNQNADGFVISVGRVGAYCGQFFYCRGKAWINNNASLIRPREHVSGEWLFLALIHLDMEVIKKGAAQPFVSNGDIAKMEVVWPGEELIAAFLKSSVPFLVASEGCERESEMLAEMRDYLLPKLLSGEVTVREDEGLAVASA